MKTLPFDILVHLVCFSVELHTDLPHINENLRVFGVFCAP